MLAILGLLPDTATVDGSAVLRTPGDEPRELIGRDSDAMRSIRGDEVSMVFQEPATALDPLTRDIDGAFLAADGVGRVRAALAAGALPVLDGADELRVGAPVARTCYTDHAPPPPPKEFLPSVPVRPRGAGRPTKKERRDMEKFRGGFR